MVYYNQRLKLSKLTVLNRQSYSRSLFILQPIFEFIRLFRTITAFCLCLLINQAWADGISPSTQINDPYIDIRTGPGRGYPVFYVSEKGDWIEVLIRKTSWFKVRTPRGVEGWVHKRQLVRTLGIRGELLEINDPTFDDFTSRTGEAGIMVGDYSGGALVAAFIGKSLTENLSLELDVGTVVGDAATSTVYNLSVLNQPFPTWLASPYAMLSIGNITIRKNATSVNDKDQNDKLLGAGVGVKIHFSRQFMFRVEYRKGVRLTSDKTNRETKEWKAGLAVFF